MKVVQSPMIVKIPQADYSIYYMYTVKCPPNKHVYATNCANMYISVYKYPRALSLY